MELANTLPQPPKEYDEQVYDLNSDETENESKDSQSLASIKSDVPLGDTFDLYDMTTRIHSPLPEITRDFTLANLSSEVVSNKLSL